MDFRKLKWDHRFLKLAQHISTWSKDPSTQVGAVLTDSFNKVIAVGYNGFPHGVEDREERYADRALKYQMVVHAEVNAILMAGDRARYSTLYVYPSFMVPPICADCCKLAIQAGVARIVGYRIEDDVPLNERQLRWKDSILVSRTMCDEAGVKYFGIPVHEAMP